MEEELLELEEQFAQAVIQKDSAAIDGFLADDWIIVDPDGRFIEKARFLDVIRSGVLSPESMQSNDWRVRVYENTAVVTGLTASKGKFMGQGFATCERATDIFVRGGNGWRCVLTQLTRFTKQEAPKGA